jgi:hypothetical protein
VNASGCKPGRVRFRCPELGRRIPRSFAGRRSVWLGLEQPQRQLAKDLGIVDVTLRNWLKGGEDPRGERRGGPSSDEREERGRLRDEKATLRMEREILRMSMPSSGWGAGSGWAASVSRG